ncbi:uncharacterized protein LOC120850333 isoform X7 [Ixodes scapularis]|uniref:uncharacterized protein LOC120850333 isoform X7 n=1 Tax=Ixodes scapularis TaxID=6945 RepID=UPI001A9F302C|nr:uncharacterized protein LOC120850333 isoform X7 [Ixodes scapularis]
MSFFFFLFFCITETFIGHRIETGSVTHEENCSVTLQSLPSDDAHILQPRTFTEYSNVGKQVEDSLSRFLSRGRYALPGPVFVKITAEKTSDTLQTCQEARKGYFFTHRLHLGD